MTTTLQTATVSCRACNAEVPAGDRCAECSAFLPGNEAAKVHGLRRRNGAGSRLDEAAKQEIRDALVADLGGEAEVSEVLDELAQSFAEAVLVRRQAWQYIAGAGPMTRSGKVRSVMELYWQAVQRVEKLARLIGTERRPADVPSLEKHLDEVAR